MTMIKNIRKGDNNYQHQLQECKRKQLGLKTQQKKKTTIRMKKVKTMINSTREGDASLFTRYCLVRARTPNLGCSNCVTTSSPSLMEDECF